jgi:hypothetical protein
MTMEIAAWTASGLVFLTFFMKTMIPLRIVAIVSNVAFIAYALLGLRYGIFEKIFPIFVLHLLLLPLNILRLCQMKRLARKICDASTNDLPIEDLIPYMKREAFARGNALFRKGDPADRIYFIERGAVAIPEVRKVMDGGTVFGEVGVFTPRGTRSASAVCARASVVYSIHRDEVLQLYYQNPKFGFVIVRLMSRYVSENVDTIVEFAGGVETSRQFSADQEHAPMVRAHAFPDRRARSDRRSRLTAS